MPPAGIPLGDILDDSGYAHRDAGAWAIPLRTVGTQLVQDLHPNDRGPKDNHYSAVIANGCLYCRRHAAARRIRGFIKPESKHPASNAAGR